MSKHDAVQPPSLTPPPRSPQLICPRRSALLVIDIQEKLTEQIRTHRRITWNASRLIRASQLLEIPQLCSEQYPEGLGCSVELIQQHLPERLPKRDFSISELQQPIAELGAADRNQLVLCGIETHVCVLQSALDLASWGYDVFVVVDAIGSRHDEDHHVALQRLQNEGVRLATTESVLFEWCGTSRAQHFKAISRLVRESPSDGGQPIGFRGN